MTKQKNSGKILLWIACIVSFIAVAINLFAIVVLTFDLWGIVEIAEKYLNEIGFTLGTDLSLMSFELAFVVLIDLFAGLRYLNILKNKIGLNPRSNPIMQTIFQMLFGSFLAGILACIGLNQLAHRRPVPVSEEDKVAYINEFKKKAMGEAITRLKELKAQGAISEEEYYETLNKILEG